MSQYFASQIAAAFPWWHSDDEVIAVVLDSQVIKKIILKMLGHYTLFDTHT